jgi:S1-C subfamily serine protease
MINLAEIIKKNITLLLVAALVSLMFGVAGGLVSAFFFSDQLKSYLESFKINPAQKVVEKERVVEKEYLPQDSHEEMIIKTVKESSPSVVSIIITKDLPVLEQYFFSPFEEFGIPFRIPQFRQKGTQKQEVGGGTGFFVSNDGLVLTNKHVVVDEEAEYTVLTNDGKKYPAKVLAKDPFQDIAILKVNNPFGEFKPLKLGDSDKLQVGQYVIAIGNALGEFRNTVSVGVISGLGRRITASGGSFVETIDNLIQTDAAINRGNSGGPLLNLKGEVIGINTAMAQGAENIGFATPINLAKKDLEKLRKTGKISYPFLGVCWLQITPEIKKASNLPVDYGALIKKGENCSSAIFPNSAAQKAGLREGDIILEWNGKKLDSDFNLSKAIQGQSVGDTVTLKILRGDTEKIIKVVLGERTE